MNGARALLSTLVDAGVDVCFANPGTSEMHFVAALDDVPSMRGILCLFEGVVTGAADGYGRVAGRPAATLLHLGPGLGNGLANLHNARRAHTPVVNIVGDHATYHARYDAPLQSDIASIASAVSGWYRSTARADDVAADAADAVAAAMGPPGGVATLVLPADASWSESSTGPCPPRPVGRRTVVPGDTVNEVAKALRSGERTALLLGGGALRADGLQAASRIAVTTGAELLGETFPANLERGAGIPAVERLAYFAEMAQGQLDGVRHLVLVDTTSPVSFFAYPGKASDLVPAGCTVHTLACGGEDATGALEAVAEAVGAPDGAAAPAPAVRPDRPTGALTSETLAAAVGAVLPEGAIVVDEGNTSGLFVSAATAGSPRHNWLTLTGGAIGIGLPLATGAAVAAPDRPVLCLQADGSAMYTPQALWTQAREGLNVTTVILSNRSYAILNIELHRVGADAGGPQARRLLDLTDPDLNFCDLALGMGVPARQAENAEDLVAALEIGMSEAGPSLVEVVL
ncbi:MAG TPA: acetolactate synthase large subunit [Acidimicrobiales bacterium]|jgi:acetolactate synthase-1/2/3 large subunit|nr:acetolactate synthase large subunit [Acidimicrobiales bacterium]